LHSSAENINAEKFKEDRFKKANLLELFDTHRNSSELNNGHSYQMKDFTIYSTNQGTVFNNGFGTKRVQMPDLTNPKLQ
jgi:hypothetical protein